MHFSCTNEYGNLIVNSSFDTMFSIFPVVASNCRGPEHAARILHLPGLHLQAFHLEDDTEATPQSGSRPCPTFQLCPAKMFRCLGGSQLRVGRSVSTDGTKCRKHPKQD